MKKYLIWSNQHNLWWGSNESGYTNVIEFAGRYSKKQAKKIVGKTTLKGKLSHLERHPLTNERIEIQDEVMVKLC